MERFLQGAPATISVQISIGGVDTNPTPDSATVQVVRSNGTVVQSSTAATDNGTGGFTYTLTPTQTALLDTLTASWTVTIGGQATTFTTTHEIAGGFAFTVGELRAMNTQLANTSTYTTASITAMRTTVEDAIEDALGFAMVPRYAVDTFGGRPRWPLQLKPYIRTVRSVSTAGTALSPTDVAALPFDENGFLYGGFAGSYSWWVDGEPRLSVYGPAVVGYEHGLDRPPERLRRAALLLAKVWLTSGPVDDRTNTFTSTDGGTFSLVTPGRGGSIFGVPEVDAAVQSAQLVPVA